MGVFGGINGQPSVAPLIDDRLSDDSDPPSWSSDPAPAPAAARGGGRVAAAPAPPGVKRHAPKQLKVLQKISAAEHSAAGDSERRSPGMAGDLSDRAGRKIRRNTTAGGAQDSESSPWVQVVAESWHAVKTKKADKEGTSQAESSQEPSAEAAGPGKKGTTAWSTWGRWLAGDRAGGGRREGGRGGRSEDQAAQDAAGSARAMMPETFDEMMLMNCRIMGKSQALITLLTSKMDAFVQCVVTGNEGYLELEANFAALLISKEVPGRVRPQDFTPVLLASLRSLLPGRWNTDHEQAWTSMWEMTSGKLEASLALPAQYERPVAKFVKGMDADDKRSFGLAVFTALFVKVPATELYFNQNNERLCTIVGRAIDMSSDIYIEPVRLINDATELGLRHIMYNVLTEYFEPFLECCILEVQRRTSCEVAVDGIAWALTQIASLIVRIIDEGATPLIKAVLANKPKMVKKALAQYSKQDRAAAVL